MANIINTFLEYSDSKSVKKYSCQISNKNSSISKFERKSACRIKITALIRAKRKLQMPVNIEKSQTIGL